MNNKLKIPGVSFSWKRALKHAERNGPAGVHGLLAGRAGRTEKVKKSHIDSMESPCYNPNN